MLPARFRFPLRQNPDFFVQARRDRLAHVTVYWLPATVFSGAVIVPQKALSSSAALSVARHRLKRLGHEVLAKYLTLLPLTVVLVFNPKSYGISLTQLETELLNWRNKVRKHDSHN